MAMVKLPRSKMSSLLKAKPRRRKKILERWCKRIFAQNRSNIARCSPAVAEGNNSTSMGDDIVKDDKDDEH